MIWGLQKAYYLLSTPPKLYVRVVNDLGIFVFRKMETQRDFVNLNLLLSRLDTLSGQARLSFSFFLLSVVNSLRKTLAPLGAKSSL